MNLFAAYDAESNLLGSWPDTTEGLKDAWTKFKCDEGPLSEEPSTWADLGDGLAYCDIYLVEAV